MLNSQTAGMNRYRPMNLLCRAMHTRVRQAEKQFARKQDKQKNEYSESYSVSSTKYEWSTSLRRRTCRSISARLTVLHLNHQ